MRWQDGKDEALFEDAMNRLLKDMTERFSDIQADGRVSGASIYGAPPVDVAELDGSYLIRAELPGVRPSDLKVTAGPGWILLEGKRSESHEMAMARIHMRETHAGKFRRLIELPGTIGAEVVKAVLENGILEIEISKADSPQADSFDIDLD